MLALFARAKVQWPSIIKRLFQIMSAFNFNLEVRLALSGRVVPVLPQ